LLTDLFVARVLGGGILVYEEDVSTLLFEEDGGLPSLGGELPEKVDAAPDVAFVVGHLPEVLTGLVGDAVAALSKVAVSALKVALSVSGSGAWACESGTALFLDAESLGVLLADLAMVVLGVYLCRLAGELGVEVTGVETLLTTAEAIDLVAVLEQ